MTQAIDIDRPTAELTRTGLEVRDLAAAWRGQAHGPRFIEALLTFLNTRIQSTNTRRSYGFAIAEFWAWYQLTHRRIPTPDKVRRADAYAYRDYLQSRTIGLDEYRLSQDASRALDLAIYRFLLDSPGGRIDAIRKHLMKSAAFTTTVSFTVDGKSRRLKVLAIEASEPRGDALGRYIEQWGRPPDNALDVRLACLVEHRLLRRTPTVGQIRRGEVDVGVRDYERAQLDFRVDPMVFSYYVDTHVMAGSARVTTVALRLTALSSFWRFLADTGENVDEKPLLVHNVWEAPLRDVQRKVPAQKAVAREQTTPSTELVARIVATTYVKSHGADQAFDVAMAVIDGVDVDVASIAEPTVYDLRDRAVILFALLIGARADEMATVRKQDLQPGDPPVVELLGKGEKPRLVAVPRAVVRALGDFYARLEELAADAPLDARIHLLLAPDAPLLPSIKLWGRNESDVADAAELRGLSPSGVQMMLRRRARRAGIDPESPEGDRVHPHGLRHRAALLAVERGRPLPVIQATLGHASLAVTGQYVEERSPERRSLVDEGAPGGRPRPSGHLVRPETPEVIEAVVEPPAPEEEAPEAPEAAVPAAPSGPAAPQAEPETEPAGLVGVGAGEGAALLVPSIRMQQLAAESRAVERLLDVYERNWGESGSRSRLARGRGPLAHTYVGKSTGLCWWQGSKGELKDPNFSYTPNADDVDAFPAMPVISAAQFVGAPGEPACDEALCLGLSALWQRWYDDDAVGRGPTAAQALVRWIGVAARVALDVDETLRLRHGRWVPFVAPLKETRGDGNDPRVLREHLDSAILSWFEATAWQYRESQRTREPIGGPLDVPTWYGEPDPLLGIPGQQREELFDWLRVLTGLPPLDRDTRLAGVSRKEAGEIISAICQYEMIMGDDDLGFDLALDRKLRDESLSVLNEQIKKAVAKTTRGRVSGFDYKSERKQRKVDKTRQQMAREAAKRSGDEEEQQVELRGMYSKYLSPYIMRLVSQLLGPVAGDDPILETFSLCTSGSPLARAGERYKNLFRVQGTTIRHTDEFAKQFARETGGHSECVARRLARHIYEEGKAPRWAKRRNWPETIDYLDALSAYRIPCPRAQEYELRDRLAIGTPLPVFEAWQDAQRRIEAGAAPDEEEPEYLAVMREAAEEEIARPQRPAPATYAQNSQTLLQSDAALRHVPNEALLAIWTIAMQRRARLLV